MICAALIAVLGSAARAEVSEPRFFPLNGKKTSVHHAAKSCGANPLPAADTKTDFMMIDRKGPRVRQGAVQKPSLQALARIPDRPMQEPLPKPLQSQQILDIFSPQ